MLLAGLNDASARLSQSSGGGVEVDFHPWSVAIVMVLFLVLWGILKPVLFEPMLKLFEERERRIDGAKLQARKIDEKSAGALAKYEAEMAKAQASANVERDQLRAEGLKTENEILSKVRAATAIALEEGKKKAQEEATRVRVDLKAQSTDLAKQLASRVLGREVQG
jgi:F-type H+-transporting ATPase subunit b